MFCFFFFLLENYTYIQTQSNCNFIGGVRIRRVVTHPTEHSWVMSSIQGNNEVSMWNIETGFRQKVLWGSTAPPLSKTVSFF